MTKMTKNSSMKHTVYYVHCVPVRDWQNRLFRPKTSLTWVFLSLCLKRQYRDMLNFNIYFLVQRNLHIRREQIFFQVC